MGAMWDFDLPDPRAGDEAAWEEVYCGREPIDFAGLDRELKELKEAYARYYGGSAPCTAAEREEAGLMQERIAEIVRILDGAEVLS